MTHSSQIPAYATNTNVYQQQLYNHYNQYYQQPSQQLPLPNQTQIQQQQQPQPLSSQISQQMQQQHHQQNQYSFNEQVKIPSITPMTTQGTYSNLI